MSPTMRQTMREAELHARFLWAVGDFALYPFRGNSLICRVVTLHRQFRQTVAEPISAL